MPYDCCRVTGHLDICRLLIDKGAQMEQKTGVATLLRFIWLLWKAALRLFAYCVIVVQMLRHASRWMG
jgi:hypothetical protein